jgi:two-component system, sensor histidine kinase PdtaS
VDAQLYIDQLIENLIRSYNVNPQGVTFTKNIDHLTLDVDTLIPLGLILNELISNTLKYAFEPNKSGQVSLSLKQQEEGLLLKISDNGQGFPPNFDTQSFKSLGFRLINSFTKKLNGVLKTWNDQGAHVEIFIPHSKLS